MLEFWVDQKRGESVWRAWDKLILGNVTWPGVLVSFAPKVSLGLDVAKYQINQEPPLKYKIRLTDKGYNPGTIRAVLEIWTPEQWTELQEILPNFSPKNSSSVRDAYDIVHPLTSILGINAVVVEDVSATNPSKGGAAAFEFSLRQWYPQTPFKKVRPTGGALNASDFNSAPPAPGANFTP